MPFYLNGRERVKTFLAFFIAAANIRLRFEAAAWLRPACE